MSTNSRSYNFCKLLKRAGIEGVSLHSYRYALAQRARKAGYQQRWAQTALGNNSKAVHAEAAEVVPIIGGILNEATAVRAQSGSLREPSSGCRKTWIAWWTPRSYAES